LLGKSRGLEILGSKDWITNPDQWVRIEKLDAFRGTPPTEG